MMVTRLTPAAKSVMVGAYRHAGRDQASEIREEHLLEALLADPDGRRLLGESASAGQLVRQICVDLAAGRRRGGLTAAEEAALAEFHIDLHAVVERIEHEFGAQSLTPQTLQRARWREPAMSADALRVLAVAERHASAAGAGSLGVEHLALGLVSTPGLLAESLARHGVSEAGVRAAVVAQNPSGGE